MQDADLATSQRTHARPPQYAAMMHLRAKYALATCNPTDRTNTRLSIIVRGTQADSTARQAGKWDTNRLVRT